MSKDLFAPVQQHELDNLYAPVTAEELPNQELQNAPGMPEAFARAMAQGATFGFSDEITAKIKSMFKGTPYEKEVEKERAAYKAAEDEHPIPSIAGELVGGVVPAMAAAPLAAASGLSKLASGVKLINNVGLGTKLGQGARLATKMGIGAAEGAATGALYGAGKSDETTDETGAGAKLGAVVGGAIPVVGKLIGSVGKAMKSKNAPEALHDVADSFALGKKGQGLISSGSVEGIKKGTIDTANDFVEGISKEVDDLGKVKSFVLKNSNKTVDISKIADDAINNLSVMKDSGSLIKEIQDIRQLHGDIVPLDVANDMVKQLRSYTSVNSADAKAPAMNDLVSKLTDLYSSQLNSNEVDTIIKNATPEIQAVFKKIVSNPGDKLVNTTRGVAPLKDINADIKNALNSSDLLKGVTDSAIPSEQLQSTERVARFIRGMDKVSDSGEVLSNRFKDAMVMLRKSNPILADELEKRVKEQAKLHHLSASARGVKTIGEGSASGKGLIMGTLGDIAKTFSVAPANVAGQAYTKVSQLAKSPTTMVKMLNKHMSPNNIFKNLVDDIVANPDENKRRAGINSLMQISAFREMMKEEDDNGEADR